MAVTSLTRKRIRVASTLVVIATLGTSCGGDSADDADQTEASGEPNLEDILSYQETDREEFLVEGAEGEDGTIRWYTSLIVEQLAQPLADAFEEKYGIDVEIFRSDSSEIAQRIVEESQAGVHDVDVIELPVGVLQELASGGHLHPYEIAQVEAAAFPEDAVHPDGLFYVDREVYTGFGYNTELVSPQDVPQQAEDLLDERWQGELAIAGTTGTGGNWIGSQIVARGEDFIRQLGEQGLTVQQVSGRAVTDMIIAGEITASPAIRDVHVKVSQGQGAPIEWVPLEPVAATRGGTAISANPPDPYSAMLFVDFVLSKEGQSIFQKVDYSSVREDMPGLFDADFDTLSVENEVDDYAAEMVNWMELMADTFVSE